MDWRPSPEGVRDNLYSSVIWLLSGILGTGVLVGWVWLLEAVSPPIFVALTIGFFGVVMLAINQARAFFRERKNPLMQFAGMIQRKLDDIEQRLVKLEGTREPYVSLRPGEVIHPSLDGVLWKWDAKIEADGPFCPRHRDRLFHKNWYGDMKTEGFEESFLDNQNFWLTCPRDQEDFKFPELRSTQVKVIRAQAAARLRDKENNL